MSAGAMLGAWSSFFVIVGSAAAALTGLMFVVITLIKDSATQTRSSGLKTFSTPTVAHFSASLLVSALLCMPWKSLLGPELILGISGAAGIVYVARLIRPAAAMDTYQPDMEDWIWYTCIPICAYGLLIAGAIGLIRIPTTALFAAAFGLLLLIALGIRNSWDVVTYIAISAPENDEQGSPAA